MFWALAFLRLSIYIYFFFPSFCLRYLSKGYCSELWQREATGMSRQQPRPFPPCGDHNDHERVLWVSQRVCKVTVNTTFCSATYKHTQQHRKPTSGSLVHPVCVSGPRRNIQPESKITPSLRQHECDCRLFLKQAPGELGLIWPKQEV